MEVVTTAEETAGEGTAAVGRGPARSEALAGVAGVRAMVRAVV